ncbi:Linear gramicidin synthase subunit D [Planctomycetes bacterium CA13]|uniref:Linear gramicidin synthase subunit D n=1 Tax=Novipirellula herctigrandis TaxID=2527986 RepID=A0A5C5YXB4_9BACT|nr:Linear gramicidin synthase subunit D [Planctomycetes bacterium CA13]
MIDIRSRSRSSYLLLTGSTGLLGEYLIRDLLQRGVLLAVVARPSPIASAAQRIDAICHRWQRVRGQALPRPVVLEGHLDKPGWGLSADQHRWIETNCDALLHNAASLQFVAESREGEPWLTNMHGTERMLELCERWKIAELHHISTAYVCGRRTGIIRETELDQGQQFGNDYEASKCASELMVRSASDRFKSVTVHRPAIITGDYHTGYTSTFHGLYAPLKIAASLLYQTPLMEVSESTLVKTLDLSGSEEKNFVSVDWVSEVISSIVCDRSLHNQTYHLTAEYRTNCQTLANVMHETFAEHAMEILVKEIEKAAASPGRQNKNSSLPTLSLEGLQSAFREQMEIYQAYWRSDPVFDRSNLNAALPYLAPPPIDADSIRRLCRFALKSNFGWPKPPITTPKFLAGDLLQDHGFAKPAANKSNRITTIETDSVADLNLRVLGDGGGDYAVQFGSRGDDDAWVNVGFDIRQGARCTLSAATLRRLVDGELSLGAAVSRGAVVIGNKCAFKAVSAGKSNDNSPRVCKTDFVKEMMERWINVLSSQTANPISSIPR